jgi:hypothetical protein
MSRRRIGNIAQLPRAIRDQVNRMLDDGCRFKAIIAWLDTNGHPGIKPNNLTEWKKGGFQEWLELDWRLAREERLRELSYDIATTNEGSKTQEAAIQIAANFLFQVFLKFDPDKLAKELDLNPQQITTVLNAFSRINRRGTELDMIKEYKHQQEQRRQAATEAVAAPALRPGLTDEGRAQIEREYSMR